MSSDAFFSFFRKQIKMEEPPSKKIKSNKGSLTNLMSVEVLPREILCIIFLYLDKKSVKSATATCSFWFELIRNDSNLSSYVCLKVIKLQEFDKKIQDLEVLVARRPVLKTIEFCGHYPYFSVVEKIVQNTTKLVKSKDCPHLEKIIVNVSYCLEDVFSFFSQFTDIGIGYRTIEEFTFNPNDDIKFLQVEHITRLNLEFGKYDIEESKISRHLKMIGDNACNLKDINITAEFKQQESIDCFQNSFCQMLKQLNGSLQRVKLNVNVLDELKGFNLVKLCELCKKLRRFHIDVIVYKFLELDDDWIVNEFPKQVEKLFQIFADVKIQFYLEKENPYTIQRFAIVTKKPYQSKAISTLFSVYR